YPIGPLLVCRCDSTWELVEQYPFLNLKDLRAIAGHHNVVLNGSLHHAMCIDALRLHECSVACPSLLYVFQQLRTAWQGRNLLPVLQLPVALERNIANVRRTRGLRGGRIPEEASQCFNRGNVALLPQDPTSLSNVLPLLLSDMRRVVCVVFAGVAFRPSVEALRKFPLVLVSRSRVKSVIEWLISNNEWYVESGITFSAENLVALVMGGEDTGVLQGIEITHLHNDNDPGEESGCFDWSTLTADLVTETVAYIEGDCLERSWCAMKASALAHAMDQKKFLVSRAGFELMNDNSPGFLTAVFPHLDPWGIGGFNHPAQRPEQQISFQCQLRNLLWQVDSPFAHDTCFPFICWNILQKCAASENTAFCISSARQHSLVNDVREAESSIMSLAEKLERNPKAKIDSTGEKGALRL
ncbi:hypothetical protein M404DRAFT_77745, partial [Pisolithus tinctorius Marx 270]